MQMFVEPQTIYLHRKPVDFRKSINGLSALVEQSMQLPVFSGALFMFCNKKRDRMKILYWDKSGFCLWMKRLEEERFRWPIKASGETLNLSEQEFRWLLQGLDISKITPHKALHYDTASL